MLHWLSRLRLILSINCEQVAMLTSAARDRRLHWHEWLAMRGHQLGCWSCRQFEKHLRILSQISSHLAKRELGGARDVDLRMPYQMREHLLKRCTGSNPDDVR